MALAAQLGVAPASVTGMIRKLDLQGLVQHKPYHGVTLTEAGVREALGLLRRHRLWELFLTDILGLSWDEVHEEAHRLEHATSQRVADRLAEFLGHPEADPHGQPIPPRDGPLPPRTVDFLTEFHAGQTVQLVEVPDDDPVLLRNLGDLGLYPGANLHIVAIEPSSCQLTIHVNGVEHALSQELVRNLIVQPIGIDA
jgi:DtxR family Mn-dependent transcriptional regulator